MDQVAMPPQEPVAHRSTGPVPPPRRGSGRRTLLQSLFFRADVQVTQEQAQAVTRIVLAALGTVSFYAARGYDQGDTPFLLALVYLLASLLYLSFVSRHPDDYLWRRHALIVLDLGVVTFLTAHFPVSGIAFYPLFLWVMIGNGIRYGQHYMQFATLCGLLGFTGALASSGFLWERPGTYIGLMFGLVLMPLFFMVMIGRLAQANIELKEQRDQAERMATHDVLTGLPNRAQLHTHMEQRLAYARRRHLKLAVAYIDLDAFKSINDSYGHEYGDYLLCQVADALRAVVRTNDLAARLGGDEFVVVIEDSGDGTRIGRVIERLFTCVGRYYTIGEYQTYVTWSCGVVVYPRDGEDVHSLLKHADTAMYAAKALGPNHYRFYDPVMSAEVTEQLALRDDLRLALERKQFELYYQPIVDARSGRIAAAEALLRWNHPVKGLLSPAGFIDIAEQTGLIDPIGQWALGEALCMAARWRTLAGSEVRVHVNLSAHQLRQGGFVAQVQQALAQAKLPAGALDLEMTESALIEDADRVTALLDALKEIGVKLSIDDFGTGFSSLSYLKRLPVDTIKIDKSFVDGLPRDGRDAALVESVLTLGERLGCSVVAEGVENAEQVRWLARHGCRYLQGYQFSRPLPRARFLAIAAQHFDLPPPFPAASPSGVLDADTA